MKNLMIINKKLSKQQSSCFESFFTKVPLIAFVFNLLYNSDESCEQNSSPKEIGHEIQIIICGRSGGLLAGSI